MSEVRKERLPKVTILTGVSMLNFFKAIFATKTGLQLPDSHTTLLASAVTNAITSPEFASLYAEQTGAKTPALKDEKVDCNFDSSECLKLFDKWSNTMSALTLAMTAAIAALQTKLGESAPTSEQIAAQIHTIVDPAVSDLNTKLAAIASSEADDEQKLADVTEAVTQFTAAFAPAAAATDAEGNGTAATLDTAATAATDAAKSAS